MTAQRPERYVDLVGTSFGAGRAPEDAPEQARRIELLAEHDHLGAADAAAELLASGEPRDDAVARCERVLALARVRSGRVDEAMAHIDRALAAATRAGDDALLGTVHLTAVSVAASTGRVDEALAHADLALPLLPEERRIRVAIQRATVLHAANRVLEAFHAYEAIRTGHPGLGGIEGALLLMNLGTALVRLDRLDEGTERLRAAQELFEELGDREHATACALHAAAAAARAGDLATVFRIHNEIDTRWESSLFAANSMWDLAECLMAAGLFDEAEDRLRQSIDLLGGSRSEQSAQSTLALAGLLRRTGDRTAADVANRALAIAVELGDDVLVARATIELAACSPLDVGDEELDRASRVCRDAGLVDVAIDGEIVAMSRWLARAEPDRQPPSYAAPPIWGSNLRRAQAHHHRALQALCDGRTGAARASLARGLAAIDRSRAALAADELRATAADRAPEMARLGLAAAAETGRPSLVLEWAERTRAASLRLAQPGAVHAVGARDELDELRSVAAGSQRARLLERRIIERRRAARATGTSNGRVPAAAVRAQLGEDQVVLEYVEVGDRVALLVVGRSRTRMIELAVDREDVEATIGKLLFGLRRMASGSGPAVAGAMAMVEALARRLDEALVPAAVDERRVVVVPTGLLHRLPWAVLPSLADRELVVAPSASVWHRAASTPETSGDVLVATGPGLPEAEREAVEIAAIWSTRHLPSPATGAVVRRLATARVAHLCCHGHFRVDSPQFSSLHLGDGAFMVIDLDGITQLPSVVALFACNVGAVDVRAGDDVLGFPAAMLARGVRNLVASSLPIADGAARDLAVDFHRALVGGAGVGAALRDARQRSRAASPAHAAAAAAITCFGAG